MKELDDDVMNVEKKPPAERTIKFRADSPVRKAPERTISPKQSSSASDSSRNSHYEKRRRKKKKRMRKKEDKQEKRESLGSLDKYLGKVSSEDIEKIIKEDSNFTEDYSSFTEDYSSFTKDYCRYIQILIFSGCDDTSRKSS